MPDRPGYRFERFWDKTADKYSKQPVSNEAAYQKKLELTRERLRPDMQVLEFACGTGTTALKHAPYVHSLKAIDVSSKMVEIARGKAEAQGVENVTFEQGSMEELAAPPESFDVIMGHSILHLLEDKQAAVHKVHTLLKPGGLFISSTVCIAEKMGFFRYVAPVGVFLGLMPSVDVFKVDELQACITEAGFEVEHQWQVDDGMVCFVIARKV